MKIGSHILALVIGVGIGIAYDLKKSEQKTIVEGEPKQQAPTVTNKYIKPNPTSNKPSLPITQSLSSKTSAFETSEPATKNIRLLKEEFDNRMNQDNLDKARIALLEIEKSAPNSKQFFESKTRYLVRRRDYESAKTLLKECVASYPKSKSCLTDLASVELQVGTKEEKENAANACLVIFPADPQCENILAMAKINQGKYDEALRHFDKACLNNPEDYADACQQAEALRSKR